MIDAQLVWKTWRRLLTSDPLVNCVLNTGDYQVAEDMGLSADEIAILVDYATTHAATDTNIGMYRSGLIRNVLGALSLVPLTRHLLYMSGLNVDSVAVGFTRSTDFFDYGPNFWTAAGDFVHYLTGLSEFAAPACQDVLALDAATTALARHLGKSPVGIWPGTALDVMSAERPRTISADTRYAASPAGVVVLSNHDLTAWIEDPECFDPSKELARSPTRWLVYFPVADAAPEYAQLSERAARIFGLLCMPRTVAEIVQELNGLTTAEVGSVINSLIDLGVVFDDTQPFESGKAGVMVDHGRISEFEDVFNTPLPGMRT